MRIVILIYSTPYAVGWQLSFNSWAQPIQKLSYVPQTGQLYENTFGVTHGWQENYDLPLTALVNDF